MAENNQTQSTLDSYKYDTAASGMEKYRETAVAFDNLIVQVGKAIAAAQQNMDENQVLFQRQVARAVKEGKLRRLEVPPINAYTMPETTLSLKMGLSIDYSEESKGPALSAVPLNATTTNQNDIDIESATEIKLRFVSVPQSQEPPGPAPSSLTPEKVQEMVEQDERVVPLVEELEKCTLDVDYKEDSRLWIIAYLEASEARLVVLVDDRTAEVTAVIDKKLPPSTGELAPIEAPVLEKIEPVAGRRGDILTIHGDNFLTMAGQTVLGIDGRPVPIVRFSMKTISFKVPGWATAGDVKVTTPLGTTGKTGAFIPIPGFERFEPKQGAFDVLRQRGTWFSVYGHNLRHGCAIEFATGACSKNIQVISPGQLRVEVPEDAGSGPLTLVFAEYRHSLGEIFFMLPRLDRVTPRQARVGEEVTLIGNTLANVSEVVVGEAVIPRQQFTLHTYTQVRFIVPPDASDGHIRVRETITGPDEYSETQSRDIFYVVPRITGFGSAVGIPGNLLTIFGEGLDPDPEMMSLLFEARTGISEAPVLAVSPDRKSLTTRVPIDAAAGFVLLLRKRVYNDSSPMDTSDLSGNKLTVLTIEGDSSDLVLDERFEAPELDLTRWTPEVGTWSIDVGMLASAEGTARLKLAEPLNLDQFSIYADILKAERFGFSMEPAGGSTYLQVWIDLLADSPALTWSRINTKGEQEYLGGIPLAVLSGQNHLVQLNVKKVRIDEKDLLELTLLLDQDEVHTYRWSVLRVGTLALLANSANQRWDNVVILKGDYFSLPEPDLYRFGSIPELPELPGLRVDTFEPTKGGTGTEVKLSGDGLDEAARFFFGGVEAEVLEAVGTSARVKVPEGARSGPIEVQGRAGVIITTGERKFLVPPKITGLVPGRVLVGQELHILGTNLPNQLDTFEVKVLGQAGRVVSAAPTMITVLVPEVVGEGKISLIYEDFEAEAPSLLEVRLEEILMDLIDRAGNAS